LHDILNSEEPHEENIGKLHKYKAKLIRLQAMRAEQIMLDQASCDTLNDEQPSLFHLIKQKKRYENRTITEIYDGQGNVVTDAREICNSFADYYCQQHDQIISDAESTKQLLQVIQSEEPNEYV
jgi:hypothetical protein